MTIPALPSQGSTSWYAWAQGIDEAARSVSDGGAIVTEVRARDISPTQDTYGASTGATAAANTTAFDAAVVDARATGARLVIPGGEYQHNGITLPADGRIHVEGASNTVLINAHASNHSITLTGVGGVGETPYAEQWSIKSLRLRKSGDIVAAGQRGISATLATRFAIEDVYVDYHDVGFYLGSAWRGLVSHVEAEYCGTGMFFADVYAGSTPLTVVDGHMSMCDVGLDIEDNVNGLTWVGGDFTGCGLGARILGDGTRGINLIGINFEAIAGHDVEVGDGTTYPASVLMHNCRHSRTSVGTRAIDFISGGPLVVDGGSFDNYTTGIRQSNLTSTCDVRWGALSSVTNALTNTALSKTFAGTGHVVSTPGGYALVTPTGVTTTGPLQAGDGSIVGGRIWTMIGYGPTAFPSSGAAFGSNGDFAFRGDGAAGSRLWVKQSGTWTGIL